MHCQNFLGSGCLHPAGAMSSWAALDRNPLPPQSTRVLSFGRITSVRGASVRPTPGGDSVLPNCPGASMLSC
jgi:hypothetical protein